MRVSPDKRRNRTCEVLVRQMSGNATNQELGFNFERISSCGVTVRIG